MSFWPRYLSDRWRTTCSGLPQGPGHPPVRRRRTRAERPDTGAQLQELPAPSWWTRSATRVAISSRTVRMSFRGLPCGSGRSQSMYRLPAMYGRWSPPIVTTRSAR